jgi:hypothetical protein
MVLTFAPSRVIIADILVATGRDDIARSLLEASIAVARTEEATRVDAMLPSRHPYRDAFRRAGFVEDPAESAILQRRFYLTARDADRSELAFLESSAARYHMLEGDSDYV